MCVGGGCVCIWELKTEFVAFKLFLLFKYGYIYDPYNNYGTQVVSSSHVNTCKKTKYHFFSNNGVTLRKAIQFQFGKVCIKVFFLHLNKVGQFYPQDITTKQGVEVFQSLRNTSV